MFQGKHSQKLSRFKYGFQKKCIIKIIHPTCMGYFKSSEEFGRQNQEFNSIDHTKIKIVVLFTHVYDSLSSSEHKRRYLTVKKMLDPIDFHYTYNNKIRLWGWV